MTTTTDYRIRGVCRRPMTLGGCDFRTGDTATFDIGTTDYLVAESFARSLREYWDDVHLLARTITDWEAVPMTWETS